MLGENFPTFQKLNKDISISAKGNNATEISANEVTHRELYDKLTPKEANTMKNSLKES